jgi:hypothetical protein
MLSSSILSRSVPSPHRRTAIRDLERKVPAVLTLIRTFRSFLVLAACLAAVVLAGWPIPAKAQPGFGQGQRRGQRQPQVEEEEEEEVDPLANLTGLLDPAKAKPLMTLEEEKFYDAKGRRDYTGKALKSLSPNNAVEKQIQAGVRFRVLRLTIPENWPYMAQLTKDLVSDLDVFASDFPRAREIAARAAVKELDALLFTDQPLFVKINAIRLLGRLNIESPNRGTGKPAVPYVPAADPLVKVLTDSQMGLVVKIAAARGLQRIMTDADPSRQMRDKISRALTDQVNAIQDYPEGAGRDWYYLTLVSALGAAEFPRSMTQQTYVVDALWKTLHDETLPWHIRSRAVRSLGQLQLDASFNVPLLVHEIVLFAGQMFNAYNQNPKQSHWRGAFADVYFAFRAEESRQQQKGWGLLQDPPAAARQVIESAYQKVLPLVNGVVSQETPQPVPNAVPLLNEALAWMKANSPADRKIHQQAEPLASRKPAEVPEENPANPAGTAVQPRPSVTGSPAVGS